MMALVYAIWIEARLPSGTIPNRKLILSNFAFQAFCKVLLVAVNFVLLRLSGEDFVVYVVAATESLALSIVLHMAYRFVLTFKFNKRIEMESPKLPEYLRYYYDPSLILMFSAWLLLSLGVMFGNVTSAGLGWNGMYIPMALTISLNFTILLVGTNVEQEI
jgi:hypothetical protein